MTGFSSRDLSTPCVAGGRKPAGVSGTGWRDIFSIGPPCIGSRSVPLNQIGRKRKRKDARTHTRALGLVCWSAVGSAAAFGSSDYMKTTEISKKITATATKLRLQTTVDQSNEFAAVPGRTDRARVCACACVWRQLTSALRPHPFAGFSRP